MSEPERSPYHDWPTMLRQVAELIGAELALKLAWDCGGLEQLYIPHKPNATHPWAVSVGIDAFAKLAKAFGGSRVSLPRGSYVKLQKRRVIEMAEEGANNRAIALACHVTERYVRRVLNGLQRTRTANSKQMRLFE